jgi:acyl-coenzyme A thioesterase PaaI-like protein
MSPADARSIRERVLRALQATRTPGFHFPGHFLDLRWPTVAPERSRLSMADGPHLRNGAGLVDPLAVCVFADVALGTAVRASDRTSDRFGTVYLQLQFTGALARGDLEAEAQLLHTAIDAKLQQRLSSATLFAGGTAICYGSGAFVHLETPANVSLGPLPWQRTPDISVEPAHEETLSDDERRALQRCDAQLASGDDAFLEAFWLGPPPRNARQGFEIVTGTHTGNRVGHVQGGLLVGAAAWAGSNATPPGMRLSSISAWYVSPGRGTLRLRSEVRHAGRNTALVRSVITTATGETVLEAMTQHVALASTGVDNAG